MDDYARLSSHTKTLHSPAIPAIACNDFIASIAPETAKPEIPDYLQETYYWAYINPRNVKLLDHDLVVRTILWQQHRRLQKAAFAEIKPGQQVLQPAGVYGSFSPNLAQHIGPEGRLDLVDVAEVQVINTRRKLQAHPQATVHHANVLQFDSGPFDVVCCYFLLHELPDEYKREAVNLFLKKIGPGGKVVFVDYHKPRWWHPLKLITSLVFDTLEPFAKGLWRNEIRDFADQPEKYQWRQEKYFGGLFQKVVATPVGQAEL
jgi:ubiquinone/menaquinone biosynthesis C-methylase UbiE